MSAIDQNICYNTNPACLRMLCQLACQTAGKYLKKNKTHQAGMGAITLRERQQHGWLCLLCIYLLNIRQNVSYNI
jgi:hypothetical protein